MIKSYKNEVWKEIKFPEGKLRKRYGVSNTGRICSFDEKLTEGRLLSPSLLEGYPTLRVCYLVLGVKRIFIRKLVADAFLPKAKASQTSVINLDHNKLNNKVTNLKRATYEEMLVHAGKSPLVTAAREARRGVGRDKGLKLTSAKVLKIKELLANPKRKLTHKQIGEKFGISDMQVYRIKSGENWSWLKLK